MIINLIAVDPGGHTGWAQVIVDTHSLARDGSITEMQRAKVSGLCNSGTIRADDWRKHVGEILWLAKMTREKVREVDKDAKTRLVVEDFQLGTSPTTRDADTPLRILSAIDFEIWRRKLPYRFMLQQPAERAIITKERLQRWGFWKPGKEHKDEMAALQHLFVAMRKIEASWP